MKREEKEGNNHFKYKSVHEYLDALFKHSNPSEEEIVKAKQEYRKQYLKHYLKSYTENNIQISFRLTKKQYHDLKVNAEKLNLKPGYYVRHLVINGNSGNTTELRITIREIIDEIDESLFKGTHPDPELLLMKLNQLEEIL